MGNDNSARPLSYRIGPVPSNQPIVPQLPTELWHNIIGYIDFKSINMRNKVRVVSPFIKSIVDSQVTQQKITYKLNEVLMMYAIGKNDLEGVKYLHSKGLRINQQSLDWAIKSGSSFRLIEHLCMHGATVRFSLSKVVEQFDLLKLIKKYKEGDWGYSEHSIPAFYASQGDLDKLKWVLDQGCPCSESTMRMAVCAGHLHVVKYCHERKCPHNSDLKFYAAFRGQLRVLEFLHEQGYPWGETLSGAVENDRVDIMKWAIDHGCPTADRMVCWNAAAHGAIKCLKFAHESGCPWNSSVLSIAVLKKHGECAAYARANGLIEEKSATEEVVK